MTVPHSGRELTAFSFNLLLAFIIKLLNYSSQAKQIVFLIFVFPELTLTV